VLYVFLPSGIMVTSPSGFGQETDCRWWPHSGTEDDQAYWHHPHQEATAYRHQPRTAWEQRAQLVARERKDKFCGCLLCITVWDL